MAQECCSLALPSCTFLLLTSQKGASRVEIVQGITVMLQSHAITFKKFNAYIYMKTHNTFNPISPNTYFLTAYRPRYYFGLEPLA